MKKEHYILLAILSIFFLAFSRLIPHPPNFTPILATCIFAGMKFKQNLYSYFTPIIAMFISDILIGLHTGILVVYPTLLITVFLSRKFKSINSASLLCSLLFFIVTNLQVWMFSSMYQKNISGLIECYTLALPFFSMTLISTFLYSYILFIGFALITKMKFTDKI